MQLINKESIKKTFVHTWYIYPLLIGFATFLWIWAFAAFHQPSAHQKLSLFFASKVNDKKFVNPIMKHYQREDLREVDVQSAYPNHTNVAYYQKLKIYVEKGDLLILDDYSVTLCRNYLYNLTDEVKETYLNPDCSYYTYEEEETTYYYGVLLKNKNEEHYLSKYMNFDEESNYYICVPTGSVNAGILRGKNNAKYDNALTFMQYLLEL